MSITSLPIKINLSSKGNAYFLNETVSVLIKNKTQTAVINILNLFTAVCVSFLIKLRWPKNKSIYDTVFVLYGCSLARAISSLYWNTDNFPSFVKRKGSDHIFCISWKIGKVNTVLLSLSKRQGSFSMPTLFQPGEKNGWFVYSNKMIVPYCLI